MGRNHCTICDDYGHAAEDHTPTADDAAAWERYGEVLAVVRWCRFCGAPEGITCREEQHPTVPARVWKIVTPEELAALNEGGGSA